ncbi:MULTISPECIES: sensor histidine kinase [Chitinophagaceae]
MNRLKNNYREYVLVFIGWLLLGLIILLFGREMAEGLSVWHFAQLYCTYFFLFLLILYLNSIVLLPKLYYANKKVGYFIVVLLMGLLVALYFKPFENLIQQVRHKTRPYWESKFMYEMRDGGRFHDSVVGRFHEEPPFLREHNPGRMPGRPPFDHPEQRPDFVSLLIFLFLVGSGFAMESNKRLTKSEQERLRVEAQKTKAELAFLKAQVNPHFLFNTLNNIYSMSLMQKEETPDAIMRLSNIMRYVTESSDVEFIELEDELHFVADYIYLNELKAGSKLELTYRINGDAMGKEIAPLLLISFIENAFKYGISKREVSPILIQIDIDNNWLYMTVSNKIFLSKDKMTENTGVGIGNTRKRLDTLYPGRYKMEILEKEGQFVVQLDVPLVIQKQNEN